MWVFNKDIEGEQASEGVVRKVLAYCDGMMCVENQFEKGAVGNLHSHPHTQITYVASGKFEFTIGDEKKGRRGRRQSFKAEWNHPWLHMP